MSLDATISQCTELKKKLKAGDLEGCKPLLSKLKVKPFPLIIPSSSSPAPSPHVPCSPRALYSGACAEPTTRNVHIRKSVSVCVPTWVAPQTTKTESILRCGRRPFHTTFHFSHTGVPILEPRRAATKPSFLTALWRGPVARSRWSEELGGTRLVLPAQAPTPTPLLRGLSDSMPPRPRSEYRPALTSRAHRRSVFELSDSPVCSDLAVGVDQDWLPACRG